MDKKSIPLIVVLLCIVWLCLFDKEPLVFFIMVGFTIFFMSKAGGVE